MRPSPRAGTAAPAAPAATRERVVGSLSREMVHSTDQMWRSYSESGDQSEFECWLGGVHLCVAVAGVPLAHFAALSGIPAAKLWEMAMHEAAKAL